jgi:hypothetical protein
MPKDSGRLVMTMDANIDWVELGAERTHQLLVLKALKKRLEELICAIRPSEERKPFTNIFVNETAKVQEFRENAENEILQLAECIRHTEAVLTEINKKFEILEDHFKKAKQLNKDKLSLNPRNNHSTIHISNSHQAIVSENGNSLDDYLFQLYEESLNAMPQVYASFDDDDEHTHPLPFVQDTSGHTEPHEMQPSTSTNFQGIADSVIFFRPPEYQNEDSD